MYNGIGLDTPRGSGTNGYVVRNRSFVKPPQRERERNTNDIRSNPKVKKANMAILEHDRKRQIEVKCMELQIKLEDEGLDDDEIEFKVQNLRENLLKDIESMEDTNAKDLKEYEVHKLTAAKEKDIEKMKKALRINSEYVEGAAFDRELQAKLREEKIAKYELEQEEREREQKRSRRSSGREKDGDRSDREERDEKRSRRSYK